MNFRKHLTLRILYEEFWTSTSFLPLLSHSDATFLTLSLHWQRLPGPGNGSTEFFFFCSKAGYHKINNIKLYQYDTGGSAKLYFFLPSQVIFKIIFSHTILTSSLGFTIQGPTCNPAGIKVWMLSSKPDNYYCYTNIEYNLASSCFKTQNSSSLDVLAHLTFIKSCKMGTIIIIVSVLQIKKLKQERLYVQVHTAKNQPSKDSDIHYVSFAPSSSLEIGLWHNFMDRLHRQCVGWEGGWMNYESGQPASQPPSAARIQQSQDIFIPIFPVEAGMWNSL